MKRALLVGIDDYDHFRPLGGCVNDVSAITPLMSRNEDRSPNFECQTLASNRSRVTRDVVLRSITALLAPGADVGLLYFAGHGAQVSNDVTLVTTDGTSETPGVKLSDLLGQAASSQLREVNVILDCCFSGGAGGIPQLGSSAAVLRPGLSILTASRGDQVSAETPDDRGLFSVHLEAALEGGAADVLGNITVAGLYAYLSEAFGAWQQRPTFKANIHRAHDLRKCNPAVPIEGLRQLPIFFPTPSDEFALDPSYEDTEEPRHEEHEAMFKRLQKFRAAKLVEPVGTDHLYYAAMEHKSCRLTPLGKHYRHMAEQGWL